MLAISRRRTLILAFVLLASSVRLGGQGQNPVALTEVEGTLDVRYEDYTGGGRLRHFVNTRGGRFELQFAGSSTNLLTGSRIRARGTLRNNTLFLSDRSSVQALAEASPSTFGEHRAIVILVNFQDNPITPYSVASAQTTTFDATNAFFLENSYQQMSVNGAVYGWYTIAMNSNNCDTSQIASLADKAAVQIGGADLSAYAHRIYAFPQTTACGWWGLGSVGGNPSQAWINGTYVVRAVAHELGHNLGEYHSHSNSCDTMGCTFSEYGDDHDIMGSTTGHLNAFQKERLGWLNYGSSPPIAVVNQTNNYWIDALESPGSAPKALKILKSADAGGQTWYYLEARARTGFDANLTAGVVIHTASDGNGDSSSQLDLAPNSTAFGSTLDPGQTFTDATLGLSITTISADATGALLGINFDSPSCVRYSPTVTVRPGQSAPIAPGSRFTYDVSVTNNDSRACTPGIFALSGLVPSGWTSAVTAPSLTLGPGANATTNLLVTSPSGAVDGSYAISVVATSVGDAPLSGSANATYVVVSSLTMLMSTEKPSYTRNESVNASARVSAGVLAAPGATVVFTFTKPNGVKITGTTVTDGNGVATYKLRLSRKDPLGVYRADAAAALNGVSGSGGTTFTVK